VKVTVTFEVARGEQSAADRLAAERIAKDMLKYAAKSGVITSCRTEAVDE